LAGEVADLTNVSRSVVEQVLRGFAEVTTRSLISNNEVAIPSFGKFVRKESEARAGRNPRTGEPLEIPARRGVKFSPSSIMLAALN
jgi:DNA-binding protein HU-beta